MSGDGGSDVHGAAAARLLPAQLLLYRLATLRVTMELRDVTVSAHDVACDVSVALGLHVDFDLRVEVDALRVDLQQAVGAVEQPQLTGLVLFLSLLPAERHLGRHDPLPLGDERALGAHTVPPAAVALVALQGRHHPVVTAAGTFRGARVAVRGPQVQGRRSVARQPCRVMRRMSSIFVRRGAHGVGPAMVMGMEAAFVHWFSISWLAEW